MAGLPLLVTLATPAGDVVLSRGHHADGAWQATPTNGDGYYMTNLEGLSSPSVRNPMQDRPGRDGSIVFDFLLGPRFPVLEGYIVASNPAQEYHLRHQLELKARSILRADGTLKWTPDGHVERHLTVRMLEGLEISHSTPPVFQLALVAGDPTVYAAAAQSQDTTALSTGDGTGLVFGESVSEGGDNAWVFPFTFGDFSSGGLASVVNGGTVDTYPTIRIYGAITSPVLYNLTTNKSLSLAALSLSAGDYVEIDMFDETVLLNGDSALSLIDKVDVATSEFWPLVPGTNSIRLSAASFDASAKANIAWRNAYA